jgi:hypothetical protein
LNIHHKVVESPTRKSFLNHYVFLIFFTLIGLVLSFLGGAAACAYVDFLIPDSGSRRFRWLFLLTDWRITSTFWSVAYLVTLVCSAYRSWFLFRRLELAESGLNAVYQSELDLLSQNLSAYWTQADAFECVPSLLVVQDFRPNIAVIPFPNANQRIVITTGAIRLDSKQLLNALKVQSLYLQHDIARATFASEFCESLLDSSFVLTKQSLKHAISLLFDSGYGRRNFVIEVQMGIVLSLLSIFCIPFTIVGGLFGHLILTQSRRILDRLIVSQLESPFVVHQAASFLESSLRSRFKSSSEEQSLTQEFQDLFATGIYSIATFSRKGSSSQTSQDMMRLETWRRYVKSTDFHAEETNNFLTNARALLVEHLLKLNDESPQESDVSAFKDTLCVELCNDAFLFHALLCKLSRVPSQSVSVPIEGRATFAKLVDVLDQIVPPSILVDSHVKLLSDWCTRPANWLDTNPFFRSDSPISMAIHWSIVHVIADSTLSEALLCNRGRKSGSATALSMLADCVAASVPELANSQYQQYRFRSSLGISEMQPQADDISPIDLLSVLLELQSLDPDRRGHLRDAIAQVFASDTAKSPQSKLLYALFLCFLK